MEDLREGSSRPSSLAPAWRLRAVALVLDFEDDFELSDEPLLDDLELDFDDLCIEVREGSPRAAYGSVGLPVSEGKLSPDACSRAR